MVWGLAWRCCIRRCVKKRSNRGARLVLVVMADPPNGARAGASPRASAPVNRLNTTAYQPRARGRGRRTREAVCARGPDWTDTSVRVCGLRIGVACRVDAGQGGRKGRPGRSGGATHKTVEECPPHPTHGPRREPKKKEAPGPAPQ